VSDRLEQLKALQIRLDYSFRNPALLVRAVTHPSYLQQHPSEPESNQRLEFLGDAVLQMILTETLFERFPTDREGALSKRRAALTKGECLSRLAREIGLDHCLLLSTGEEQSGGRRRAAALEDAFEAVIGALYLDSDLPTTRRVVLGIYGPIDEGLIPQLEQENPKGRLQEIVQPLYGNQALRYDVIHISGEDHAREYEGLLPGQRPGPLEEGRRGGGRTHGPPCAGRTLQSDLGPNHGGDGKPPVFPSRSMA
jgi:ribonuclease III